MAKKKQGSIPGMERKEIGPLTDAAEAYRKTVLERMQLQRVEADQKAHLSNTFHRYAQSGELKVITDTTIEQSVYSYEDEDGALRVLKYSMGQEKLRVSKADGASE